MKKILIFLATISIFSSASAATKWQISPAESKIEFSVNQSGSEITGSFKKISGDIFFDKTDLKNSKVDVTIDLTSVNTSLSNATTMLLQKDWFFTTKFPKAKFTANKFTKISENKFRTDGILEIKDHKVPTSFEFSFDEFLATKAKAVGSLKLSRSAFDVGNKDEKLAEGVKDEVAVKISISATKI
jgi:polyisoprenoid-binding protein YceI